MQATSVQRLLGENPCHFKELKKVVMWELFHPASHQMRFSFHVPTKLRRRFLWGTRRCPARRSHVSKGGEAQPCSPFHDPPRPKGSGHGHGQRHGQPTAASGPGHGAPSRTLMLRPSRTPSRPRPPRTPSRRLSPPERPRSRAGRTAGRVRASPRPRPVTGTPPVPSSGDPEARPPRGQRARRRPRRPPRPRR